MPSATNSTAGIDTLHTQSCLAQFKQLINTGNTGTDHQCIYFYRLRTKLPGGGVRARRTAPLIERSTRNFYYLCCLLQVSAQLSCGNLSTELGKTDIALLDSTRAYEITTLGPIDVIWLAVPRHRLEGRISNPQQSIGVRIDGSHGVARIAARLFQEIEQLADQLPSKTHWRLANSLLDLIALAIPETTGSRAHRSDQMINKIHEFIEQHLCDESLTPERIAEAHGISVRYLNRLFQRECTSTAKWMRLRRLERCRDDLENSELATLSISEIAFKNGFTDISTFNRAFRKQYATAPRSLRPRQQ